MNVRCRVAVSRVSSTVRLAGECYGLLIARRTPHHYHIVAESATERKLVVQPRRWLYDHHPAKEATSDRSSEFSQARTHARVRRNECSVLSRVSSRAADDAVPSLSTHSAASCARREGKENGGYAYDARVADGMPRSTAVELGRARPN
jgi:hypothetical protein